MLKLPAPSQGLYLTDLVAIQGRGWTLQSAEWQRYFCSVKSRPVGCPIPAAVPGFSLTSRFFVEFVPSSFCKSNFNLVSDFVFLIDARPGPNKGSSVLKSSNCL